MNNVDAVHPKHGLADDNITDIKDNEVQYKQDDQHNCLSAPVENDLQLRHQLES